MTQKTLFSTTRLVLCINRNDAARLKYVNVFSSISIYYFLNRLRLRKGKALISRNKTALNYERNDFRNEALKIIQILIESLPPTKQVNSEQN